MAEKWQEIQEEGDFQKDAILQRQFEDTSNQEDAAVEKEQKLNLRTFSVSKSTSNTNSHEGRRNSLSSSDSEQFSWVFDSDPEGVSKEATVRRVGRYRPNQENLYNCQECGQPRFARKPRRQELMEVNEGKAPVGQPVTSPRPPSIMKKHQQFDKGSRFSLKIGRATQRGKSGSGSKQRVTRQVTFNLPDSPGSCNTVLQMEHPPVRPHLLTLQRDRSYSFPITESANMFFQLESSGNGNTPSPVSEVFSQPINWKTVSTLDARNRIEDPGKKRSRWILLILVFALCMLGVTAATTTLVYIKGIYAPAPTCPLQTTVKEATKTGIQHAKSLSLPDQVKNSSESVAENIAKCQDMKDINDKQNCIENKRSSAGKEQREDFKRLQPILLKDLQRMSWKDKSATDLAMNIKNVLTHNLKGRDEVVMRTDDETALIVLIKRKPE